MDNEQPSIKKNFIFSTAYQVLTLIAPLITAPYISRVLGAGGVGVVSYTTSIQMYFSLFAGLGTASYGMREIARNRNDVYKRSRIFWEIELLTIVTSAACLSIWGVWVALNSEYRIYYIVLTLGILAAMLDISWLYSGMEQFEYIVLPNSLLKILSIIALFVFVRNKDDAVVYLLINMLSIFLGNAAMWFGLKTFVKKVSFKELKIWPHFKETVIYFVPTIATSIYTVLDKTLIGLITHDSEECGFYEQATKIINMSKVITFTAINNVMCSRISYLFAKNQYDEIKQHIANSMEYIMFLGFGIMFGIIGVSEHFVPVFFGSGYDKTILLLNVLSPMVVIVGISNCLGSQYYTPVGKRATSAKFLIAGAIVNLFLNILMIPKLEALGASIASLISEIIISALYLSNCGGYTKIGTLIKISWKKILAGLVMLAALKYIGQFIVINELITLCVQIIAGVAIYIIVLFVLSDKWLKEVTEKYVFSRLR